MTASQLLLSCCSLAMLAACTAPAPEPADNVQARAGGGAGDRVGDEPSAGAGEADGNAGAANGEPAVEHPEGCPIAGSSDWAAWVDAMPGPGSRPTLIVTGSVTVPTGGYRLSLELGPLQEIEPPFQMVYLLAVPPDGPATQALETREVRGEFPGRERYSGVSIVCGGRLLADIRPVEPVH